MHTGFGVGVLEPGGTVPAHVHSFEESVYILDGHGVLDTAEGVVPARAGRLRAAADRRAARLAQRRRRPRCAGPRCRGRCRGPGSATTPCWCPRCRTHDPVPVDVRDPRTRRFGNITPGHMDVGQAEPGHARGVGEHAHRAARLQRNHREDDGRQRPRRRADHDVHGAVRPRRRGRRARPSLRGDLPVPRGRGRRGVRRRDLPARRRRRRLGRRRMRARVRQRRRRPAALAGDPVAAAAGPALVPLRAGLGLPARQRWRREATVAERRRSWSSAAPPASAGRSPSARSVRGDEVVITGRDADRTAGVAKEIGGDARGIAVDLSEPDEIAAALADIEPGRPSRARGDRARHEHGRRTTTSRGRCGW